MNLIGKSALFSMWITKGGVLNYWGFKGFREWERGRRLVMFTNRLLVVFKNDSEMVIDDVSEYLMDPEKTF